MKTTKKDWFRWAREQMKSFWTREDAHRWGEEYDLDPDDDHNETHHLNLINKYKWAINTYLRISATDGANRFDDDDDLPTTPRGKPRIPERQIISMVLNHWAQRNSNAPIQFRDIGEYDEFLTLNEKRKRYHKAFEQLGGKWGEHFARSIHDNEHDKLAHSATRLRGSGLIDWMKKKYQSFTAPTPQPQQSPQPVQQPQPQPQPQPVIIPPNQPLPPEIPSTNILQQIASNAYKESPQQVEGFNLLEQTPTLKYYRSATNPQLFVFGVRGTVVEDKNDRSADLSFNEGIVGNNLKKSARYMKDKADIENFLSRYNLDGTEFIVGAGHSLGGAMNDELLHDGLIDYAVSFNPAVQPKDVNFTQFHRRIYLDKDPLYQSMARNNVKNNIEVRQTKATTGSNILGAINSNLGTLWQTKGAHSIDNFVGGKKKCACDEKRKYDEETNVWVGKGECMCPKNYSPVMGKDGKTYNNRCEMGCADRKFDETENRWVGGAQYFSFYEPDSSNLMFAQELQPQRCNFKLKNRNLCKRKQNIGTEYCFQHLPSYMKLKIKETNDGRGKGVFVIGSKEQPPQHIVFKKGDIIAKYNGEEIDRDELLRRYGEFTAPYTVQAEEDYVDAAAIRGVGAMINAVNISETKNCILAMVKDISGDKIDDWNRTNPRDTVSQNDVVVMATKNIKAGAQLLLNYGDAYEFQENHSTGTKKPKETHGINIKNGFYAAPQRNSAAEQPVVKQKAKKVKQTNTKRKRTRIMYDDIKTEFRSENDLKKTNIKCFYKIPMNLWVAPFLAGLQNYIGAASEDFAIIHTGYWGGYEDEKVWNVEDNVLPIMNTLDLYMTPTQSKMKTDAFLNDKSHMFHPNQSGDLMSWDEIAEEVKGGIRDKQKALLFCVNIQPFDPRNTEGQNHSGLLIYDRDEKTLSFYDPMGAETNNTELKKIYKKDYYNKQQLEKYHGIFKKIASRLGCRFRTSYDTHNQQLLGFQKNELTDNSIKNGCMWWCFYMYYTIVNAYANGRETLEEIINIHYDAEESIVSLFKKAVFRIVNMINKEVQNQNIVGVSSPFIPKTTNTKERDKLLIDESVKVAKFYGTLQE
jgi:hypothetical protein